MSDLLQVMLSGRPVWCRRLAERGMHPSASLIEAWKSGHDGFGGSLKSLVVSVEVAGLATTGTLTVELAVVAAEVVESASEDSSSLSVSTKSSGFLMAGAASRNSNGSASVPFPKNMVNRVHSSRQSVPAIAINKCCKASCFSAAALASNSEERRNKRRACKKERWELVAHRGGTKMWLHRVTPSRWRSMI